MSQLEANEPAGPSDTPRSVAVLVIHGVGSQKPGDSVRAGVALLEHSADADYTMFEETSLRVPVRKAEARSIGGAIDDEFMVARLANYEPADGDSSYATTRHSARRRDFKTHERRDVHVYELFWADLSRLGSGFQRWLMELYDLTFLVCVVGGIAIQTASSQEGDSRSWKAFGFLHHLCQFLLTRVVPIFALTLLWIGTPLLVARVPADWRALTFAGLGTALALAVIGYAGRRHLGSYRWLAAIAGLSGIVFWSLQVVAQRWHRESLLLLAALTAIITGLALTSILWRWGRRREGLLWVHLGIAGVAMGSAVACLAWEWLSPGAHAHNLDWFIDRTIRAAEWFILPTELTWVVLFLVFTAMVSVGWVSMSLGKAPSAAVRAARWTATLSVFLPALTLMMINIGVGMALAKALPRIVGPAEISEPGGPGSSDAPKDALDHARHLSITPPWWGRYFLLNGSALFNKSQEAAQNRDKNVDPTVKASDGIVVLVENSSRYLPRGLALLGGGFVVALWSLLPAILSENRARIRAIAALEPDLRRETSMRHGRDMDTLFRIIRCAGNVICIAVCLSVVLMLATLVPAWKDAVERLLTGAQWEMDLVPTTARLVGIAMLVLILSHGWFRVVALGLRNALDVGLDALNWLRPSPRYATPRARIVTRFTAMLHHLERWRNPITGRGYDALVILAHSEGSMIAVESLRFWKSRAASQPNASGHTHQLERYFSDRNDALPISLFTMGNPLRQLFVQRFPHLYHWGGTPVARHRNGTKDSTRDDKPDVSRETNDTPRPPIPDLNEAGLHRWWNAYRSGDYVGRNMWPIRDPHCAAAESPQRFEPATEPPASTTREADFCIGAGAHLRYWDETAPLVSQSLDRLVATA
jgi:hypothetical protein